MEYRINGEVKTIGDFGTSTRNGFDIHRVENETDYFIEFEVWYWNFDEENDEEYECRIGVLNAFSEFHAKALLRDRIYSGKYPKGAWLEYTLNGKTIELDVNRRVA